MVQIKPEAVTGTKAEEVTEIQKGIFKLALFPIHLCTYLRQAIENCSVKNSFQKEDCIKKEFIFKKFGFIIDINPEHFLYV